MKVQLALIITISLVTSFLTLGILSYLQFENVVHSCNGVTKPCFTVAQNLAFITIISMILTFPCSVLPYLIIGDERRISLGVKQ